MNHDANPRALIDDTVIYYVQSQSPAFVNFACIGYDSRIFCPGTLLYDITYDIACATVGKVDAVA